ncbi:MAG: hypothetical protein FJ308_00530 [Planctomycetes bacterium]|nr:hypothetical protein [Planctomycetota bacterium]
MLPSNLNGLSPGDPRAGELLAGDLPTGDLPTGGPPDGRNTTRPLGPHLRHRARRLLIIVFTLIGIWGCGWLVRFFARSDEVARLASMILFAPAPIVAIWFGWRTRLRFEDWLVASLSILVGFLVWNSVMLQGLNDPVQFREVVSKNAVHWFLFLIVGTATARSIQWASRIGIWSMVSCDDEPETKALSVIRLMGITATVAVFAVSYRAIFHASLEEAKSWIYMGAPSGPMHWYSWFPLRSKIWVSGAIGGVLIGFHWYAVVVILRLGSYRMPGLVLWSIAVAGLRWSANQIYWGEIPIWIDLPITIDLDFRPSQIAIQMLVEGTLQTLITCVSIYGLRGCGFRIGKRGRAPLP